MPETFYMKTIDKNGSICILMYINLKKHYATIKITGVLLHVYLISSILAVFRS